MQVWDSLWRDANLITLADDHDLGIRMKTSIAVHDGQIVWLGHYDQLPTSVRIQQEFDCRDRWMTPGLIDCHTHLVHAGQRAQEFAQRMTGVSYTEQAQQGGGIQSTVRATRAASEDELLAVSQARLRYLLREGVTTVEIKSGYGLDYENEAKMLRCARQLQQTMPVEVLTTFLGAHALPPEWAGDKDGYIQHLCDDMLPALAEAGLVDAVDGFCERIAFNDDQLARLYQVARRLNLPVKCHADQLSDAGGAELAAQFNALSADHLEYSPLAAIEAMGQAGVVAVLLPGAFYCLQEKQLPPIDYCRQNRVPMAFATDANPGSSPVLSLLLIMNLACTLWRVSVPEAIMGVTCHAAKALGLGASHGRLREGMRANFAIWDISDPCELVCQIGQNPCVARVLAGQVVTDSPL